MFPRILFTACLLALFMNASPAQEIANLANQWRFSLKEPGKDWIQAEFDDSKWATGKGGFGTRETPGAKVGTEWSTNQIWLRKPFQLASVPPKPALLIHHDEDAEVYINGKQVATFKGFTTDYQVVPMETGVRGVLRTGKNLIAVKCVNRDGGQFIDVHLVDADNVPKLPPPPRENKPFQSELITKWGEEVTPENAWQEYPRPQMQRDQWRNLNGKWDYAITSEDQAKAPEEWEGKILVPFSLESKLGGVQRLLHADEALWYRRTFQASPAKGERTLLNFEAVDYRCEAFVNGKSVGTHQGGNTPFSFDISDAVRSGENELIVRVEDETEEWQLRGKQVRSPKGIWYTQVSGIWQTVWLEQVSSQFIEDVKISTNAEVGSITIRPIIAGGKGEQNMRIVVKDGDEAVATAQGHGSEFTLSIEGAKLWSPDSPHLYDLEISLLDRQGQEVDRVKSYAGIRTVGKVKDENGHWRFTLNGEQIFHWGPLDQGWWPDGLLTPPSDEGMRFDIEFLKASGFNMIRKHTKVEPRRYYYHCDKLGMMIWQDQVSGGARKPPLSRLKPDPKDAEWPDKHHEQFMLELERMIDTLENHPSIVMWVPFNERWGQHRTVKVGEWAVQRDPSRHINIASGGNFWPVGDIVDEHKYPHPAFPFDEDKTGRFDEYIKVIGEFGGHGYLIQGHIWDANRRNFAYGELPQSKAEFRERLETSLEILKDLRVQGIAGGVYTQTTDVEIEINGLMTYDRKIQKIEPAMLKKLADELLAAPDTAPTAH